MKVLEFASYAEHLRNSPGKSAELSPQVAHERRWKNSLGGATLVLVAFFTSPLLGDELPKTTAGRLVGSDRVLVIAHRGDSKTAPENTIPAFESAVAVGADMVELDYHHSQDGIPMVMHDETLDRTTDAKAKDGGQKIRVDSKTAKELGEYEAGEWFDPRYRGTWIPSLEEALDAIQVASVTLIEQKAGDAKTCVDLLERKELVQDVVIQSFHWEFVAECAKLRKDLVLGCLGSGKLSDEKLDAMVATGAHAIGWQFLSLRREDIERIHNRGLKVWAWTVDDAGAAQRLIDWNIDGIITNVPEQIKKIVEKHPRPVGVETPTS